MTLPRSTWSPPPKLRDKDRPPQRLTRTPNFGGGTSGPVPKAEKAKPGKRTPNAEERRWIEALVAYGCIACRMDGMGFRPAAVHHILRGGRRMGHLFTLPLCDPGHHQGTQYSRHPFKARFEAQYGTEAELLARLRAEIGAKS